MAQLILNAEPRTLTGKRVKQLREQGLVPAIVYGKATSPIPVQISLRELELALTEAGEATLLSLSIAGESAPRTVLVRDEQRDVIKQHVVHADFYEVVMTEKLRVHIPLVLEGQPPILVEASGVLIQPVEEVEAECLPADLVSHITVDVSGLKTFDDAIFVRDLVLPPGIEVLTEPEDLVAKVSPSAAEVEAEEEAAAEVPEAEVEVIKKGKKEEEAAEGEAQAE
jgi:large subunit ribosomal protein L25